MMETSKPEPQQDDRATGEYYWNSYSHFGKSTGKLKIVNIILIMFFQAFTRYLVTSFGLSLITSAGNVEGRSQNEGLSQFNCIQPPLVS